MPLESFNPQTWKPTILIYCANKYVHLDKWPPHGQYHYYALLAKVFRIKARARVNDFYQIDLNPD